MSNTNQRVFNLLDSANLNWSVDKIQLVPETEGMAKPDSFGIFCNAGGQWLGTVGKQYTPVQNQELGQIFIEALEAIGHQGEVRGGHISGRRKVYLQASLEDMKIGTDTVKRWITTLNSHDGSSGAVFGSSNTVVICQNTFFKALREAGRKVRHTASAVDRIKLLATNLVATIKGEEQVIGVYRNMAQEPIQAKTVNGLLKNLFGVTGDQNLDTLSTKKANIIRSVAGAIQQETDSHGKTIWGLFNGITYYTNHLASTKDRETYLMAQSGYRINKQAFEFLANEVTVMN